MQVKGNYIQKHKVRHATETMSMKEVYDLLIETGYRCIPVLDEKQEKYLGNAYKVHILEFGKTGSLETSITEVLKDKEEAVLENASFFEIFKAIKRYPFVTVIDEANNFKGILTHSKVFELLETAWGLSKGGYALTLTTNDYKGALNNITAAVGKFATIQSLITLDNELLPLRRIIVSFSKEIELKDLEKIKLALEKKGFRIIHIEEL